MLHFRQKEHLSRTRCIAVLSALLQLAATNALPAAAQTGGVPPLLDLGIIVMPTQAGAEAVLKQLNAGGDFFVLAKEKSIDATAIDGGYMGELDPNQLRMELRDALKGLKAGQLASVTHIASGFAILKVLTSIPALEDVNPNRITSLVSTGVIHRGAPVSGFPEASAVLRDYPKPDGWSRDLRQVCALRTASIENAKVELRAALESDSGAQMTPDQMVMKLHGESALAQFYAYSGEMKESIAAWKEALKVAEIADPRYVPNLLESIGATYLHWSEMENGV
jgi:hypothetical protein